MAQQQAASVAVAQLNLYPLDPSTFSEWLATQPAGAVVGIATRDADCPISRFLSASFGGSWIVNFAEYRQLFENSFLEIDKLHELPGWASCFVKLVDYVADYQPYNIPLGVAWMLLEWVCLLFGIDCEEVWS